MASSFCATCVIFKNLCFCIIYRFFNFVITTTQVSCVQLCPIGMYTFFFFTVSICFVVCIHFNVNLFCFVEFIIHFQCVFLWRRCLCGFNHEHCLVKYYFPLVFIFLCFCTMSNGPHISLPFGSIFYVNNLVWSINGSNIFVVYRCSDELFINSCFVIENVSQFHVLSLPKSNPNLFGHFFYPYISLNLDEYDIPSSSCSSIDFFMHPSMINVVSSTSNFILCPIVVNVFFSYDSILCLTYVIVSYASYFVFSPTLVNVCFASDSIFCPIFVCVSCPYDYQLTTT